MKKYYLLISVMLLNQSISLFPANNQQPNSNPQTNASGPDNLTLQLDSASSDPSISASDANGSSTTASPTTLSSTASSIASADNSLNTRFSDIGQNLKDQLTSDLTNFTDEAPTSDPTMEEEIVLNNQIPNQPTSTLVEAESNSSNNPTMSPALIATTVLGSLAGAVLVGFGAYKGFQKWQQGSPKYLENKVTQVKAMLDQINTYANNASENQETLKPIQEKLTKIQNLLDNTQKFEATNKDKNLLVMAELNGQLEALNADLDDVIKSDPENKELVKLAKDLQKKAGYRSLLGFVPALGKTLKVSKGNQAAGRKALEAMQMPDGLEAAIQINFAAPLPLATEPPTPKGFRGALSARSSASADVNSEPSRNNSLAATVKAIQRRFSDPTSTPQTPSQDGDRPDTARQFEEVLKDADPKLIEEANHLVDKLEDGQGTPRSPNPTPKNPRSLIPELNFKKLGQPEPKPQQQPKAKHFPRWPNPIMKRSPK